MSNVVNSYGVAVLDDTLKIGSPISSGGAVAYPIQQNTSVAKSPFVIAEYQSHQEIEQEQQLQESIHPMQQQIVENAMAEAENILSDAINKAESLKAEILKQASQDSEKIKIEAQKMGYQEGVSIAQQEVKETIEKIENAIARFEGDRAGFEQEYHDGLKWMSLEIASKILAKRIFTDDADMLQMVEKAVRTVEREPWVRVEVAQEMTHLIAKLEAIFKEHQHIEISPMPIQDYSVLIETPSGVLDVSVATQLENLKNYFRKQNR